jgi:hypothetical protein
MISDNSLTFPLKLNVCVTLEEYKRIIDDRSITSTFDIRIKESDGKCI